MKMIPMTCQKCNGEFFIRRAEYNRQLRNGRKHFFCSLSCAQSYNKKTTISVISNCLWCQTKFETTTHKKARKCCSLDCAHKYAQSKVDKNVHKQSIQREKHFPQSKSFVCVICKNEFEKEIYYSAQHIQVCSPKCCNELLRQKAISNPNCGGETGYRHYNYKGIWMDSQWEVDLAKWMDDKKIVWERSRKNHMFWWTDGNGQKRRYYPDFYLPEYDLYVDPKNKYKMEKDRSKIEQVIKENGITLSWGLLEDVKKEIDILRMM